MFYWQLPHIGVAILIGASQFLTTIAHCCTAPDKPSFYGSRPIKPSKPYCLTEYSNTCSQYEVEQYNREVEDYNNALNSYNNDVDAYISRLKAFIEETVDYAKCEAKRVSSE